MLFDDYAMGGIDILYDMLSKIDYENQVDNIRDIIERYIDYSNIENKSLQEILEEET